MPFWFVAEISSPTWGSISAQNLVSAFALYLFSATKRDQHTPTFGRKKNVTMDKMKVNKQQTMKEKGNCSSSHYRNNSGISEVATKFVTWESNPLESLAESKVYQLRVKLNKVGLMSREEKNWLAEAVNSNSYFRTAPLQVYRFDFLDVLKKYLVNQYGHWAEYYAPDRTSLRNLLIGQVNHIVEIPKQ
ncbi:hypothetical protein QYZ87_09765 [Porphyromonadaceae bacterium W3.11]|nr:hypothetical protein [Porphyromonadaceae bacterium W3.11]